MSLQEVLSQLRALERRGEITAWIELPAQAGEFSPFPADLFPALQQVLHQRGISRLYSHQRQAWEEIRQGRHLLVVTPTASGKTLCYNLPVLQHLLDDPQGRALYLFPTKALAQDQMAELRQLVEKLEGGPGVHTYDGDTPADMRRKIRREARIILTNPDMLHAGILPHHPRWVELFRHLRYVVVDELHTYRGVFGSHVANVFRRLKRVARFYGSEIQFIGASATIANPRELAEKLLEEPVQVVERNGAPRAARHLIFYNPPLVHPELGLRRSVLSCARRLAEPFLRRGIQTLIFTTTRVGVEVLLSYLRKAFPDPPGAPARIRGYRGGYLPHSRREIEGQLRNREICGVVSTNALELGIDIGSLDCCILAGYPGTIASTWQQMGRAGRRSGQAVAILAARNLPLDQFIIQHPEYFLQRSPEHGLIDPENLQILVSHVKCAAFELPFRRGERFGGEDLEEILAFLEDRGIVCRSGDRWHWSEEAFPADSVSLRTISEENFVIFNRDDSNRAVAEVDFESAPELIHPEAIYICEGRQYQVERLDYEGRRAYVREVQVDYYTEAVTYSALKILRSEESRQADLSQVGHGEVHLVKKFPGFKKIRFYTGENLGYGKIDLPVQEMHTCACWLTLSEKLLLRERWSRSDVLQALVGISYSLHHVATLLLMCDLRDLGRSVGDRSGGWFVTPGPGLRLEGGLEGGSPVEAEWLDSFQPTFFLYENHPAGLGFAEKLFQHDRELLDQARQLISACSCRHGCPSCVGPVDPLNQQTKQLSLSLLDALQGVVVH